MTAPDEALDEYMEEILSDGGGKTMTARIAALPLWQRRLLAVGLALLVLGLVLMVVGRPLWQLQVPTCRAYADPYWSDADTVAQLDSLLPVESPAPYLREWF